MAKKSAKSKVKTAKPAKGKAKAVKAKAKAKAKAAPKPSAKKKIAAKSKPKSQAQGKAKAPARPAKAAKPAPAAVLSKTKTSSPRPVTLSHLVSPLDDRVIVRVEQGERVTAGGLFLPDTVQTSGHRRAFVVAVGRGHRDAKGRLHPVELKVGDRVLFSEHVGSKVTLAGEEYTILSEREVLGLIET